MKTISITDDFGKEIFKGRLSDEGCVHCNEALAKVKLGIPKSEAIILTQDSIHGWHIGVCTQDQIARKDVKLNNKKGGK